MLENITVIEFGRIFSAPHAGRVLADLGAKVIKIERKNKGDESRHYGKKLPNGESDYYHALNYNKEVIELDLKEEADLNKCYQLLKDADVLIHNSLQKSFDKLGLSYETVSKLNPRIIYLAISGYGYDSKYRNEPSQDAIMQGLSGFMSLNGKPDCIPLKTGVPVIDYITGQNAIIGILASLYERKVTNRGKLVTVSLYESALNVVSIEAVRYLNLGEVTKRTGNRHSSIAPYNSFPVKDGYIIVTIANDEMFYRFMNCLQIQAIDFQTNELRLQKIEELEALIAKKTSNFTSQELLSLLKQNQVSCGPIHTIDQAFQCDEVKELDLIKEVNGIKHIATPIHFK